MSDRIYYSKEAEERAQRERTMIALFVLGLGLGIGTLLALLFAPQEGEKTRRQIAQGAEEAGKEAGKGLNDLQKEIDRLRKDMEERVRDR